MRKLICMLHHPLRLVKVADCTIEDFANDTREIVVYTCRHCGKIVLVRERCIKGQFLRNNLHV